MWLFQLKSLYYPSISRVLRKYTSTRTLSTRLDYSVKKEASNSFVRLFSNESNSECCSHQTIKRKRRWWSQSITSREPFTTFPIGPLSVWWYDVQAENLLFSSPLWEFSFSFLIQIRWKGLLPYIMCPHFPLLDKASNLLCHNVHGPLQLKWII